MGVEVTEEMIRDEKPDAVIVATGAKPLTPPIKGMDGSNVVNAEDVLLARKMSSPVRSLSAAAAKLAERQRTS